MVTIPLASQLATFAHHTLVSRLNTKLESNGYPPMMSLVKDLSDGVRLIQLMASALPYQWTFAL
jgi:hypothetical protein